MAPALPDRIDCVRLADDAVVLERVYPLSDMPRLQDLLADSRGSVRARFAFAKLEGGRAGATVAVDSTPQLRCQRCLQGLEIAAAGSSEIQFASSADADGARAEREIYVMDEGRVSLQELAEEELLLTLPIVAMHPPRSCPRAPAAVEAQSMSGDRVRPFAALQDLLKKT